MISPAELALRWRRQWNHAKYRETRLLSHGSWPISLPIGLPTPTEFELHTRLVREHVNTWRTVAVGKVSWETIRFRSGSEPVELPVRWVLHNAAEWAEACANPQIRCEYERLTRLLAAIDPLFGSTLIRQSQRLQDVPEAQIIKCAEVALALAPGCAAGRPLRAVSICGIDSKFFERHRRWLTQLLDIRFDGEVNELGLEVFLDALDEDDHWLLVVPLSPGMLPFKQQRVRASELSHTVFPGSHIVIVENEKSLHQLPELADTIAILGAGLHLDWMQAEWLRGKRIAYWGDLDTWGLLMLATARRAQPELMPIMMTRKIFETYALSAAVEESRHAAAEAPQGLAEDEQELYRTLLTLPRGRLEQEFLPEKLVREALFSWRNRAG